MIRLTRDVMEDCPPVPTMRSCASAAWKLRRSTRMKVKMKSVISCQAQCVSTSMVRSTSPAMNKVGSEGHGKEKFQFSGLLLAHFYKS